MTATADLLTAAAPTAITTEALSRIILKDPPIKARKLFQQKAVRNGKPIWLAMTTTKKWAIKKIGDESKKWLTPNHFELIVAILKQQIVSAR